METLTKSDVEVHTGIQQEPGKVAHYVKKSKIAGAYIEGTMLEALCGHKWVPSKDPKTLPVCQQCEAIFKDNEAIILARGSM